ncbi:MFS transporter [Amorphoplanes digitatis]|nr:MFS transporter [Actinoplanes digitatis]
MANYGMAALREKNFRRLFLAQTASALGNALVPVAIAFAVLDLTDSPTALGIVLGTRAATQLLFILAGGVIADRFPRRVVMIAADGVRCLTGAAVGMLLLVAHPSLWTLVVLFGIDGIAAAVFTPAAAGMTPAVVSPGNLQQANMLQAMTQSAAAIAGPAIAGVLVVTAGPGWAVLATAASLAVGLVFLGRIRVDRPPRPADPHFLRELRQGWDELRGRTWFWAVVLSSTAVNGLIGVYMVLGPQASRQFYGGAAVWAAAVTAGGVGAALGGFVTMRLRRRHPLRTAVPLAALYGLLPIAFAAGAPPVVIMAVSVLGSVGALTFGGVFQTLVQQHIPEHLLSRVSAYEWVGGLLVYPMGLALAGTLAGLAGVRTTLLWVGAIQVAVVLVLLLVRDVRNVRDRTVDAPVTIGEERHGSG